MSSTIVNSLKSKHNEFYKSDVEYDIELNRMLLKLIGIWPLESDGTKIEKIRSKFAQIVTTFVIAFLIIPNGYYIFCVEKDFVEILKLIGAWNFCGQTALKYAIVLTRRDGIKNCIDRMAIDWKNVEDNRHREIMLKNAKTCRVFTKLCVGFMYSGSILHSSLCVMSSDTDNLVKSEMKNLSLPRPHPFPSEFFIFDSQISPMYEIIFFCQVISMTIICTISCGLCTLTVKFVMHAYSQYEIVISVIEGIEVDENSTTKYTENELTDVVQRHLDVLTFVPKIETVLTEVCLIEMVGCTLNICFLGYYIIAEMENSEAIGIITYMVIMMSVVSNIFIFCYVGELLTEQSKKVGLACYMIDWWYLPSSQAKAVVMLIAASDFPVQFTAGKMIRLSLRSFASVIKAAATYLNVLRNSMA